jgi:hypothetical protein
MRPDHARVHRERPLDLPDGVVFDDDLVEDPIPRAVRGPPAEAFMRGLPGPIALREITPRRPGAELPEDRVDHLPVITPLPTTTPPSRQQALDPRPRHIRQLASPDQAGDLSEHTRDSQDTL